MSTFVNKENGDILAEAEIKKALDDYVHEVKGICGI